MMPRPRILLLGRKGQVAWELRRTLAPRATVVSVGSDELDLAHPDAVRKRVRETRPDLIVNAAAYTGVDTAESETERAMAINGIAPGILAEEARRIEAWLVHYSTDYVYAGDKREPYVESDPPHPLGMYGRSKLAGDEAIASVDGRYLIFRLCWVYGLRGHNFLLTIQRLARERERLRVVADQTGCPTWSRMIAEATSLAVQKVLGSGDPEGLTGIYNLAASTHTTWHEFATEIVGLMPADTRKCQLIEAITTAEYPTPARRPAWSVLSCEKLEKIFGVRLPGWREMLQMACE
jgi:dTDP-4-dehydrorhamnose reductase